MKQLLLYTLLILSACTNDTTGSGSNKDTVKTSQTIHTNSEQSSGFSTPALQSGCYQQVFKKDTSLLTLEVKDSTVQGSLYYHRYEKDRNTGTFTGTIKDSLLTVMYTFQSEGMTSQRQVIFKRVNDQLYEAIGPRDEATGKSIYIHSDQLQYNQLPPFIKVDCNSVQH